MGPKLQQKKVMGPKWNLCHSYGTKIATKKVMGPKWNLCHSYGTKIALKQYIFVGREVGFVQISTL